MVISKRAEIIPILLLDDSCNSHIHDYIYNSDTDYNDWSNADISNCNSNANYNNYNSNANYNNY